jgi:hypothetical protein
MGSKFQGSGDFINLGNVRVPTFGRLIIDFMDKFPCIAKENQTQKDSQDHKAEDRVNDGDIGWVFGSIHGSGKLRSEVRHWILFVCNKAL